MSSASDPGPSIGELSRQVQGVLVRVENVVSKLETQYVSKESYKLGQDIYKLWQESMLARIAALEDTNKWLVRLIVGAVIIMILGAVFSVSGGN